MEFLISFLAGIFAFIGGIVGNVLANDLCVSADRTCSRIIKGAARRIGDDAQGKRYEEEWLADLAERETVHAKYSHAIGCYLVGGKIRRESRKIHLHVLYFVPRYGKVMLKFNLSSYMLTIWFWAMGSRFAGVSSNAMQAGVMYYIYRFARQAYKETPHANRLLQLVELAGEALMAAFHDWRYVNGIPTMAMIVPIHCKTPVTSWLTVQSNKFFAEKAMKSNISIA